MLEKLLKKCYDEEFPTNGDSESVKTAVLSRIEKENHMKRFRIKPLIIAATVSVTAAASIVTASAATDGGFVDRIARLVSRNSTVPVQSVEHVDAIEDNAGHTVITYEDGEKAYRADTETEKYGEEASNELEVLSDKPNGSVNTSLYDDNSVSLEYMRDFFGNDNLPIDEKYKNEIGRNECTGNISCIVDSGTIAKSPVDGKVIAGGFYPDGRGNAITVEFGSGRTFTVCHLDEISVGVGDAVTAGQQLGICGETGGVIEPMFTLILVDKDNN